MFLKNYTSDVAVSKTIFRIEQVLIKCGVSGIMKEYGSTEGDVRAVTFRIQVEGNQEATIRLPVKVEEAQTALWLDYVGDEKKLLTDDGKHLRWPSRKKLGRKDFREQAERTAWRIVQDWVEVQMSMIQMKQADVREVFLPYIWDGKQTVFDRVITNGFRALLPEKT